MARRVITQHLYDSLVIAYRERPGNHSNAAKVAGCERRMARRAFESGWAKAPWAVPIKAVLEREQVEARALVQSDRTSEYQRLAESQRLAQADAIEARAQEGKMVRMARGAAMALLSQSLKALKATQSLTARLEEQIANGEMTIDQVTKTIDRIAHSTQQAVAISKEAMRMERLHLGEPEQIVAMQLENVSTDELVSELQAIESVLRAASHAPVMITDASPG